MGYILEYCKPSRGQPATGPNSGEGNKGKTRNNLLLGILFRLFALEVHLQPVCALVWTVDYEMVHVHGCIQSVIQSARKKRRCA